ncbi:hypothetical protein [Mycobacterium terramassiliense]|uniref:hypothetical protein n=1 Tax=Mycobacterium terramassiliense TaxID=1841859 RepID=UPI0012FFB612|nr:hypothetical protein [Mycobacterium terramassiliense]
MATTQIADAKQKMSAIRSSLAREVDAIRSSPNYTDAGRRQELAKTLIAHRKQAAELRDSTTVDNDSTRAALMKKLFGIPADADAGSTLAYRDAVDRAAQLRGPEKLEGALKRATAMGDTLLARAVAARAHELGIREVAEEYAETTGLSDDYDDLNAVPSSRLASIALFGLPAPQEVCGFLGGVSDSSLQRIADGEDGGANQSSDAAMQMLRPL